MGMIVLLGMQLAATLVGFTLLWRKLNRLEAEVRDLRAHVDAIESGQAASKRRQRVAPDSAVAMTSPVETPRARAARAWGLEAQRTRTFEPPKLIAELNSATIKGVILALTALAPALGLLFNIEPAHIVACGLAVGVAEIAVSLLPAWRAATWAGVATSAAWAAIGLAWPQAHGFLLAIALLVVGVVGVAFASRSLLAPGATMASAALATALALGAGSDMASAFGAAYAGTVLSAALAGAANLRLEPLHFAAFIASILGLFVLSGQPSAAVWFTPAAGWTGAVFLAIAAVRAPELGARGATLAGTGALAPYAAIAALYAARHGLADRFAAGGAFLALTLALLGVAILVTQRRNRGSEAAGLTFWTLGLGAFVSAASAIMTALPAPLAAPAFAALTMGCAFAGERAPHALWRTLAVVNTATSLLFAAISADLVLSEVSAWPNWALIASGLALPSASLGAAAWVLRKQKNSFAAGASEFACAALAIAGANLAIRMGFSVGAIQLNKVDFVEAGAHISLWLLAALVIGALAKGGARSARVAAAATLGAAALAASALSALLWLTPFWANRPSVLGLHQPLGFLAPALLFATHWVFWRARGANTRTRIALGAAAVLTASFITLEVWETDDLPEWLAALMGALAFAGAIVINFAPGVALSQVRRHYLRESRRSAA